MDNIVEHEEAFVAKALLTQIQALRIEIPGVRLAVDPECIHRMRVASRRLRAMLSLFAHWLPEKSLDSWEKQARRITRAMGAARDLDVQILFLQEFLHDLAEVRYQAGVARVLLRLTQSRARAQQRVLQVIDGSGNGELLGGLEKSLRRMLVRSRYQAHDEGSVSLLSHARQIITERITDMQSYEIYLDKPPDEKNQYTMLHAMRIAAKRLRYTMNILSPLFGTLLEKPLKSARDIQDQLGALHDCDVWIVNLPRFLVEEHQRMIDFYGHARGFRRLAIGIQFLLENRLQVREQIHHDFIESWSNMQQQQLWERLLDGLHAEVTE